VVVSEFHAVPPDLHDGAGVVFCNPERTRLLAQMRAEFAVDEWDDGSSGESAAESARRFSRTGARSVKIFVGPRDLRGAAILHAACLAEGLLVEYQRTEANGTVAGLPEKMARKGATKWINLPSRDEDCEAFLHTFAEWCSSRGVSSLRITPPPLAEFPATPQRRSPLPAGLGLDAPEWRKGFLWLVAQQFPRAYPAFLVSVGAHEFSTNPVEDFYAGLGLRERNAELLVNIAGPS
jgi:hypothetical protein